MDEKYKNQTEVQETMHLRKIGCAIVLAVGIIGTLSILGIIYIITNL